jgi:hypothetical protein
MWLVGIAWIVAGIMLYLSGALNWDPDGKRLATAFWDAVIGRKWSRRLAMFFGVVVTIAGIMVVIHGLSR